MWQFEDKQFLEVSECEAKMTARMSLTLEIEDMFVQVLTGDKI